MASKATSCLGARIPQQAFNENLNLSNALVYVQDMDGNPIGQAVTNNLGEYTAQWTGIGPGASIRIGVTTVHSRFTVGNTSGQPLTAWTDPIVTSTTSTPSNPQIIPTKLTGPEGVKNPYFNTFFAVELVYRNVLSLVGVFTTNFTAVDIRGFANTIPGFTSPGGTCNTSCANGPSKRVQLDAAAGYAPSWRSMHEVGHIASYLARPWAFGVDYTLGGGGNGWVADSTEYGSALFEEAMASHYANLGLWFDNAVMPTSCLAPEGHCYTSTGANDVPVLATDIEATSFGMTDSCAGGSGGNNESRWPISGMRFLWDVYDTRNDAIGDAYSATTGHYWQHASLMQFYPAGTGTNQHEEPWNTAKTTFSLPNGQPDGRGATSYQWNYANSAGLVGTGVPQLWVSNCSPK